jgi:hypothetical protein
MDVRRCGEGSRGNGVRTVIGDRCQDLGLDKGDDDSVKSFFEAIPGLFNSKLVKRLERDFPEELLQKFEDALDGFLGRTWSSNSVDDSEKRRRLDISMNGMNQIGVCHV